MRQRVTFDARKAILPDGKLFLGVYGDNLIEEVAYRVPAYAGGAAYIKMRQGATGEEYKNGLNWDAEYGEWVLSVTRAVLAMGPKVHMQVQVEAPGSGEDTVLVWQSEIFPALVSETIDADAATAEEPTPYLQALDARVQAAAVRAENASRSQPYVGTNGNWYVWHADTLAFVDSGVKATGPQGPSTISMGTTTVGATPAVTNSGDSTHAVLNFVLPSGVAAGTSLADAGGFFPTKNVEAALQQIGSRMATNLRVGGNFADTTGVTAYQVTATAASNKLRLVATGTGAHWASLWTGSGLTAGHTYYARIKISGVAGIAAIEMINQLSSGSFAYSGQILPNAAGVASLTMAMTSLYSTPYTSLRAELANASGSYSFTAGSEEASFEYLTVLDLTAIFGAGFEPTAAQMDSYLAFWSNSWFDGATNLALMTHVIPALVSADRGLSPQVATLNRLAAQGYDINLINTAAITSGYYINASGVPAAMSGIAYSDYVSVVPGERYEWYNVSNADSAFTLCGAYYDSNKAFLAAVSGTEGEVVKGSTASAGAAYLRINIGTSKTASVYLKRVLKTRWHGKKMVVIGDSITYGYSLGSPANQNWARLVAYKLGAGAFVNYGVSGSKLAPSTSDGGASYVARYSAMDSDADLVLVFVSTNDYGSSSLVSMSTPTFGTPADRTDASYYGSLHVLFTGLLAKYAGKRIVIMTPIHRTALSGATGDDYVANPDTGKCLQDYVDAAKAVARYYGLPVLDLFAESGAINPNIPSLKTAYMPDGLHPNFAGHQWIADAVCRYLWAV